MRLNGFARPWNLVGSKGPGNLISVPIRVSAPKWENEKTEGYTSSRKGIDNWLLRFVQSPYELDVQEPRGVI
jgi:hypothetical protein